MVPEEEEPPAEPREELGDLETNDLMQFAYQIATGMVRGWGQCTIGLTICIKF